MDGKLHTPFQRSSDHKFTRPLSLAEKGEWPPMKSANFEQEDAPGSGAKYDIQAKPHTYYLEAEGTGAIPVNDVVVHVSTHVFQVC